MPEYPYFSCSRISTFRKCPKAFEFSYIKGSAEEFETIEKHLGTAVHEVFEWVFSEIQTGRTPSLVEVEARYRETWSKLDIPAARIVKKGVSAEDYFSQGLEMTLRYHQNTLSVDDEITLHIEYPFDYDLGAGRLYHGIIDRVARHRDGMLRLVDYKTGRSLPDVYGDLQLRSYCLPMFAIYPDDVIEICYEGLREGRSLVGRIHRRDVSALQREIHESIDEILSCQVFPARPSTLCAWCGHQPNCTEGRLLVEQSASDSAATHCPRCGSELRERNGRFGPFFSCSRFPACRFSRNK